MSSSPDQRGAGRDLDLDRLLADAAQDLDPTDEALLAWVYPMPNMLPKASSPGT